MVAAFAVWVVDIFQIGSGEAMLRRLCVDSWIAADGAFDQFIFYD